MLSASKQHVYARGYSIKSLKFSLTDIAIYSLAADTYQLESMGTTRPRGWFDYWLFVRKRQS